MPAPTYAQLMNADKAQLEAWGADAQQEVADAAAPHITYRNNLISYAEDLLDKAENGIGSNPPGNPPPPPGA